MANSVSERVQRRRDTLRAQGLRPVQLWLPDVRKPGFDEEYRRQARVVAASDRANKALMDFLDEAGRDIDELLG